MMDEYKSRLCCPALIADLPRIVEFVEDACEQAGVAPAARFDLQLAVEEACTNVIEHAYAGRGGDFSLEFDVRGPDVVITVRDRGEPFDPTSVPMPDRNLPLERRPIGGLGMYLMRQLMDEMHFSFGADGNVLEMVKRDVVPTRVP